MVHKFNPANQHKLDNPERRKLLPPEETLSRFGLAEGDSIADIGCGTGYFTLSAARVVGTQGKVYALDIMPEMLEIARAKAKEKNFKNIEFIETKETDFILPDAAVERALACLVVHEADDPIAFFQEVKRILQIGGHFYIIEWTRQENSKMGPPLEHRIDGKALATVLEQAGFQNVEQFELNSEMYAIIVKK
ncbi:Methyltransferase domain-containing protein [Propionispira arboris]|uniref:Methyltransferase domain-containing protein n=1 Tax=Propionispira arboris TaxID=84035 RepID=A0A1H6ZF98_9FIRM|nr:methyltransferase domain-containing protein [Propionispira arboris]SEJ48220.1 Methyltransferase domain-containing protein [Propionispira arboris]